MGEGCPCGSGDAYDDCCRPLHDGRERAATAEQLMRSRYAAYATGRLDHVFRTWHPRTRPDDVRPVSGLAWTGLSVLGATGDENDATVEFEAHYLTGSGHGVLHERSRFTRRAGRWVYVDGEVDDRRPG